MKTADLIPFLLLELNESDKYGFELTKNIETKSGGKIVIKQPTLYTLLKKLEKSKFITSYWEDSEIGGKRHYYKITDNGKMQLSTLPSYDVLMQNLLENEENNLDSETSQNDSSINDVNKPETNNTDDSNQPTEESKMASTPLETILPTEEVFSDDSVDSSTKTEINQANADVIKPENNSESFATNIFVAKFVDVTPQSTPDIKPTPTEKKTNDLIDLNINIKSSQDDVKFVDYVNLKTSKEYQTSKKFSKFMILRSSLVSLYIIALLISFAFLSKIFGTSVFYYISFILGSVIAIFYPIITAINIDKIKAKYKPNYYKFNTKSSVVSKLCFICFILLIVFIFNIAIKNNSFNKIFALDNFTNFYEPILLCTSLIVDTILAKIFISKLNK